ncbi:helix-turn-helix domain-containing protein [Streptomyces sp. NBC_00564]|uniref:helix-turn-helix domain-containing protein n=1 Tax=unclassified Streptomyces TaxID=2593676 RepID=UPI003246F2EC|nr:helix-turn-helix transcriptional regulator [Streptomyces sp. NBC_00564]
MTPGLQQLVQALGDGRGDMKLADVAKATHYSISALSDATSGKRIPTIPLIEKYAAACGMDPAPLLALRQQAVQEKNTTPAQVQQDESPASSAPVARHGTAEVVRQTIGGMSLPKMLSGRREEDTPSAEASPGLVDVHMATLIQQAMASAGRTSVPVHVDPITGALSLCTVPKDLMELLRALWTQSEVSLREMEQRVRRFDLIISRSSLHKILNEDHLPPVDVLAAIVGACSNTQDHIDVWLYHRARLEIAEVRHRQSTTATKSVDSPGNAVALTRISYGTGRSLQILMAACSLMAALVPLLMRL